MSSDISQLLQTGLEHHQSGRLREAEAIYQSLIKDQPQHPDAWHLLGILAHQAGNNEAAVNLIEKAIEIKPDVADFYNNCGEAYRAQQNYDKAISMYEQALAISPGFAGASNNLGNTFKEMGRLEDAVVCYKQAIANDPDFFIAHNNLGIALKELGRPQDAVPHYEKAIDLMPGYAEAHNNLGNVLQELEKVAEAVLHYRKAIAIMPGYAEAHSNLGNALRELDRQEEAIDHYHKAIAIKPDFAMAHYNLGIALDELGRPEEAINAYEQAIAIKPDYAEACNNLGFALQELGCRDDAIRQYQQALVIRPDYAAAHLHLSMIVPEPAQAAVIEELLRAPSISEIDASHYHFALGNLYNHVEKFDQAFEHYLKANEFKRNTIIYNPDDYSTHVDKLIETFTKDYLQNVDGMGSDSDLPVFIVGLPRSGTTLIEQILSSHPRVYGAGELVLIQGIEQKIANQFELPGPYPRCMSRINHDIARKYSDSYLQEIRRRSADALRITDKDPGNSHRIGLIKTLFPGARIIHCQRIAMDTCLSIFFNYFARSNTYSFDLRELGQYYLDHERLMAHWCELFPGELLTVKYEDLVRDQEKVSRQLIEHIGLDWDERCLDFHLNKRAVRTASSVQVRQPLYTQSINRWKHYEKHLAPLIEILNRSSSGSAE